MIHDLLLSCLCLSRERLNVKDLLATNAAEAYFHPCEQQIFERIINILDNVHEVVKFVQTFGLSNGRHNLVKPTGECTQGFFYLTNFTKGIEYSLEEYYDEIVRLEGIYLKNSKNSLIYAYNALEAYLPIAIFLRKLIREQQTQNLHGCILLQHLHVQSNHGDNQIEKLICKVMKPMKLGFFSQLANWMLFGKIDDQHSEFFIKYTSSQQKSNTSIATQGDTSLTSSNSEEYIWQYEINMQQLPGFISTLWAEKILFIGQTVLVFKMDRSLASKCKPSLFAMTTRESSAKDVSELWEGKEAKFFQMINDLNDNDKINIVRFELIIDEIKKFVSKRLSEIAVNEVNLERQMELIKDFYLLGRGEFYMEFLRQLYNAAIMNSEAEISGSNYIRSFEIAAAVMGMSEDLEHFSLSTLQKNVDPDESCEFGILENIHLRYIYHWPLNLLFSPKAIDRYNKVFRHLLIIRRLQYDLHHVWAYHTYTAKKNKPMNVKVMNLRNHLMFFIDNMQYYIQVDVLESQFSIFINVVKSKADFEEIQRAHSIFLANVLSQCFLLSDSDDCKTDSTQSICQITNPVHGTILEIFSVCEKFSSINYKESSTKQILEITQKLEERFDMLIGSLIKILEDIKTASSLGPLSQLLLRLDYNHWFSATKKSTIGI